MLILALIKPQKLPALREAFSHLDWQLWEVCQFQMGKDLMTRIVIQCDEMPPDEFDIPIEAIFEEPKYCHICAKKLQPHNISGYCYRHQDKDPKRRSPRNKKAKLK